MQESKHKEKAGAEKTLNFSRLQEEHAKAIRLSQERIDKWVQFRSDYEALQATMYTLPDKLTHDVMVPFGKFAFIPGQLYDTNEILVLLGDNWFIKRSVKQALEIAERRKQNVTKMLEDERKQMSEWEARHAFTSTFKSTMEEHEDTVEIKEEYNEEKERKRKERRQRNIQSGAVPPPRQVFPKTPSSKQHSPQSEPRRPHNRTSATSVSLSDKSKQSLNMAKEQKSNLKSGAGSVEMRHAEKSVEELWARLDELEREEEEYLAREGEEEEREVSDGEKAAMFGEQKKETAKEKDEEKLVKRTSLSQFCGDSDVKDTAMKKTAKKMAAVKSSGASTVTTPPLKITIRHTSPQQLEPSTEIIKEKEEEENVDKGQESEDKALFSSPADIFRRFCKPDSSDEEPEQQTHKRDAKARAPPTSSPSSVGKGVTWNPTLVEFSDGSKSPSEGKGREKSDPVTKRGRGRGNTSGRGSGRKPSKPPMPFSGQVVERFAPAQPITPHSQDGTKKVSKFKASRKQ